MKKIITVPFTACILLTTVVCTKSTVKNPVNTVSQTERIDAINAGKTNTYIIKKGAHYCTPNPLTFTSKGKLTFTTVFDSSCIIQRLIP